MCMGNPGRPRKNNERLTLHVHPEVKRALKLESAERDMTISAIVEEALMSRLIVFKKKEQ